MHNEGPSTKTLAQVLSPGTAVEVDLDAARFDSAKGAHTGKPGKALKLGSQAEIRKEYCIQELLDQGFEHLAWDGKIPGPVIDNSGRIVSVLAEQPGGDYAGALDEVFELFQEAGRDAGVQTEHPLGPQKRGHFPAFNRGVTMGMGSPTPVALQTGFMGPILDKLVQHKAVRRMAAYQEAVFALWGPRLYAEYKRTGEIMRGKLPHLPRNFNSAVFAAAAFNLGGKVIHECPSRNTLLGESFDGWKMDVGLKES
ncbi:hypothetical protein FB446DRAFT_763980 [Lentinula raphanica]|nr:hypothetical protein FB446DRAFT_763980 [Lentinula raphanica]